MTASNMGNAPERNSNAKEERKLRKPLIEKRRRERINCSLEQLKGIMVDAYNLDQSKLEKADVLEVTVQHMEGLQKGHGTGSPGPSAGFESRQRYSSGYIQCMHEVHNLLLSCPGMDKPLGARLLNHLLKSLPHLSSETGSTRNTGSPNGAVTTGGSGGSCNSSPLPGSGPASPPQSPLSLPSGAPFRPRRLQLHAPASPSPPAHPQPPSPSHRAPLVQLLREGRGIEGWVKEQPASPTSSPPFSPNLQPGVLHPALPPFFPGGDPSMWRPW